MKPNARHLPQRASNIIEELVTRVQQHLERRLSAHDARARQRIELLCDIEPTATRHKPTRELDIGLQHAMPQLVRNTDISIADITRLYRNETTAEFRPNKVLCPSTYMRLVKDFPHQALLIRIAYKGIGPAWVITHLYLRSAGTQSAIRYAAAVNKSIAKDQTNRKYLVLDGNLVTKLDLRPFAAVEKAGCDPNDTVRLIHNLSFPSSSSPKSIAVRRHLPSIEQSQSQQSPVGSKRCIRNASAPDSSMYRYCFSRATFRQRTGLCAAAHVRWMCGWINENSAIAIDMSAPFG